MIKKKVYKQLTIEKSRAGDLISAMNEREIPKEDIVYIGATATGYLVIYQG
jgi:hypothetical protein